MAIREILEIIKASGEIVFFEIDPQRELINLGSHPDNDIVITSEGIAPFHAMLDLRRRPYQFVQLGEGDEAAESQQVLSPSATREIHTWDTIELGDTRITLIESEMVEKRQSPQSSLAPVPASTPVQALARPGAASLVPPSGLAVRPPDQLDDAILTEPVVPEYTLEAGQTLTLIFSISNGGEMVADFDVSLEGLDQSWVTIMPASMRLNLNQHTNVIVSITPPRAPASRAGAHHFAVMVTSPNYPGRMSRRGATLVINPFYEFAVGELSPRQLTISWDKRTATASLSVVNQGNSQTRYRIEGNDDDHACTFEFQSPGESVRLANQTDFPLAPDSTAVLPIFITSRKRRLVGLRSHDLPFTVTTSPMEGSQPPRTVMGRLTIRPLIGSWKLLVMLGLLLALTVYAFWPRLSLTLTPTEISAGQPVQLRWTSWPPFLMTLKLNGEPLDDTRGEQIVHPVETTRYQLTGDTWASRIFSPGELFSVARTVSVTPVTPQIVRFQAQPPQVDIGAYTEISWSVSGADRVVLVSDNSTQTLDTLEGSLKVRMEKQTFFTLKAYSDSLPDQVFEQELSVAVNPPQGRPAPVIVDFRVEPATITAGQDVTISWQVNGAEEVAIQPLGDHLPASGSVSQSLAETTLFTLSASNGQQSINALRQITVNPAPPTPTSIPAPLAPTIALFTVSPAEPVQVGDEEVEIRLDWVISGNATNVSITGGPLGRTGISQLNTEDSMTLNISEDAVFVLRATNGDQQSLATLEVRLNQVVGPAVPAPYNFYGEIRSNDDPPPDTGNLLSWDYDNEDDIRGFRIYRNDGSGFDQLVDEDELDNEDRDYFDADDEECMSYYVVAVYLNDSGSLQESNASNQWTSSCP